ncbi:hypothetical protein PAMA111031_04640 [Paraphotobacterium marinum]
MTKSLKMASNQLFISPPAVWKHIKNLELQCGEDLFIKTGIKLELSDFGRLLLLEAKKFLTETHSLNNCISSLSKKSFEPIRIAFLNSFQNIIFNLIQPFIENNPSIPFELSNERWADCNNILEEKNFDFVITADPPSIKSEYKYKYLGTVDYGLFCSSKHILKDELINNIANLENETFVTTRSTSLPQKKQNKLIQSWRVKKKPIYVDSFLAIREAVLANMGIGLITTFMAEEDVIAKKLYEIPLDLGDLKSEIFLIYTSLEFQKNSHEIFYNYFNLNN